MAVDTKQKRASALSLLMPFMVCTPTNNFSGVVGSEKLSITYMYIGIDVDAVAEVAYPTSATKITAFCPSAFCNTAFQIVIVVKKGGSSKRRRDGELRDRLLSEDESILGIIVGFVTR